MIGSVDLLKELLDQRAESNRFIEDVNALLRSEERTYASIMERLRSSSKAPSIFNAEPPLNEVFDIQDIRKVALKFRLRFLPTHLLKANLPMAAVQAIKEKELELDCELHGFNLLAPEEAFDLKDENADPLLFADMGDGHYIFVHKWGSDLSWHRFIMSFPLRNPISFGLMLLLLGIGLSLTIPTAELADRLGMSTSILSPLMMIWVLVSVLSAGIFLFFSNRWQFTSDCWNKDFS